MKYLTKIGIQLIVGCCLVISGLVLSDLNFLNVKALDNQTIVCNELNCLDIQGHYIDIDVRESDVNQVYVYATELVESTYIDYDGSSLKVR